MKKVVWMFSGQGSQLYHMGRQLYEQEPVFRSALEKGDAIVSDLINESVLKVIYAPRENRFEPFRAIRYTHPAILLVEYATAQLLLSRGLKPDLLLGYSLGELSALIVAGSITFEAALVAVTKQATLLEYLSPPGGMLAILASPELAQRSPDLFQGVEIAACNFPTNFTVTGPSAALDRLQTALKEQRINVVELPVEHPFHSREMTCLERPLDLLLDKITVKPPSVPVISAEKTGPISGEGRQLLEGIRNPVNLTETIRRLEQQGDYYYVDLGPSGTMATSVKYNLSPGSTSELFPLLTPFGHDLRNIEKLEQRLRSPEA
jgi:acyl transferase domain-containing protein